MCGHLSGEAPTVDEMPFLRQEQVRVVEHVRALACSSDVPPPMQSYYLAQAVHEDSEGKAHRL